MGLSTHCTSSCLSPVSAEKKTSDVPALLAATMVAQWHRLWDAWAAQPWMLSCVERSWLMAVGRSDPELGTASFKHTEREKYQPSQGTLEEEGNWRWKCTHPVLLTLLCLTVWIHRSAHRKLRSHEQRTRLQSFMSVPSPLAFKFQMSHFRIRSPEAYVATLRGHCH
jgi:hypothetical protein